MLKNTIKYPYNFIFDIFGYEEGQKIDGENFEDNLKRLAPKIRMKPKQIEIISTKYKEDISLRQTAFKFGFTPEGVRRIQRKLKERINAKEITVQFYKTDFNGELSNGFKVESTEAEHYTEGNTSIYCLALRERTFKLLKDNNVETVQDLKAFINNDFNGLSLTDARKQELKDALNRLGVKDNDMQVKDILLWVMQKYDLDKKGLRTLLNEIK